MGAILAENPQDKARPAPERLAIYPGLSLDPTPAPLPKRVLAYAVDTAIIMASIYLALFPLIFGISLTAGVSMGLAKLGHHPAGKEATRLLVAGILIVAAIVLISAADTYFIYFEYKRGMTPGKRLFGLRVIPLDRARLTLGQCVRREMFRYIDCGLILPGLVSVVLSRRGQRIGDLASRTLVIHSSQEEEKRDFLYIRREDYLSLLEALAPSPIPGRLREAYLRFAYPAFGRNGRRVSPPELSSWEEAFRPYIQERGAASLTQESLLRFLAEHCSQIESRKARRE